MTNYIQAQIELLASQRCGCDRQASDILPHSLRFEIKKKICVFRSSAVFAKVNSSGLASRLRAIFVLDCTNNTTNEQPTNSPHAVFFFLTENQFQLTMRLNTSFSRKQTYSTKKKLINKYAFVNGTSSSSSSAVSNTNGRYN